MNILINGYLGFMGREVAKLCDAGFRGATLAIGVDAFSDGSDARCVKSFSDVDSPSDIDCIVDFSHHSCIGSITEWAVANGIPTVVATTGHTEDELSMIRNAAKHIPVFHSGNMSLGIALLIELAKKTAAAMPEAEIEIIEKHHNRKIDAPSGTALMIADAIREVRERATVNLGRSGHGKRTREEIGIHSVRMGNIVGVHEVIVGTENQTITLTHEAHSRALFAEGALAAAEFLTDCAPGLYDMNSLISGKSAMNEAVTL
ncbi:MAG: 4-hydroxy-tetrahydrodipicolinate reductase [Clostridia bacterium]|nr:4-hydroxy-tetrahydrodipicolinate reductase [Clostridia bacterium]